MKRAIFLAQLIVAFTFFLSVSISFAYTSPGKPQGFVSDFANVLNASKVGELNKTLSDFNSATTIQIAVVTISSLDNDTIESYSVKLFEEWKIGQTGKDNGVLLLVAMNDKKVKIEVGYGLESVLTDSQSNGIIQKVILPEFKSGNFENGIMKGTEAIISVVKSEANYSSAGQNKTTTSDTVDMFLKLGLFVFIILISILGSTKSWWLGGVFGAIAGIVIGIIYGFLFVGIISIVGLTLFGLLFDYIVSKGSGRNRHGGGFWGGSGGGGGFGGGSGGFGGFGGGRSGGGGASGGW